jgi:hypothetical protein
VDSFFRSDQDIRDVPPSGIDTGVVEGRVGATSIASLVVVGVERVLVLADTFAKVLWFCTKVGRAYAGEGIAESALGPVGMIGPGPAPSPKPIRSLLGADGGGLANGITFFSAGGGGGAGFFTGLSARIGGFSGLCRVERESVEMEDGEVSLLSLPTRTGGRRGERLLEREREYRL